MAAQAGLLAESNGFVNLYNSNQRQKVHKTSLHCISESHKKNVHMLKLSITCSWFNRFVFFWCTQGGTNFLFLHRSSVKAMTDNLLYSHQCLQETCLCSTLVLVFLIKTCLVLVYAIYRERIIFGESGSTCKLVQSCLAKTPLSNFFDHQFSC